MDDSLEQPTTALKNTISAELKEEGNQSSDEEDGGPDWTKIPSGGSARPVIPKRGEKDFEPSQSGGSALQQHMLDRIRTAMFSAIDVSRTGSSKSISYGTWVPKLARAHVTTARGIHFTTMGHSVPRPSVTSDDSSDEKMKTHKRLELLPEEALYLIERGSMFCWKEEQVGIFPVPGHEDVNGAPMTVQQAYAEMIGKENLTLEKYQVFAYLKRLGYIVTRAQPPTSVYPTAPPHDLRPLAAHRHSWLKSIFSRIWSRLELLFSRDRDWWKPIQLGGLFNHNLSYLSIFASLRFIPSGHGVPLHPKPSQSSSPKTELGDAEYVPLSPYKVFYHLYKPSTSFRKTAPPTPDFSLVVINARTTPMPSLHELTALFDGLPEVPLSTPRQRQPPQPSGPSQPQKSTTRPEPPTLLPFLNRLLCWAFPSLSAVPNTSELLPPQRKPNPFQALKFGKKNVIIAVVDAGTTSFFRFGQGSFAEWPMTLETRINR